MSTLKYTSSQKRRK